MSEQRRRKGCPNPECERHIKKVQLKTTEEYCPKCGTKLTYVCAKCFAKIEDENWSDRLCVDCMKEAAEKKEQRKEQAKELGNKAVKVAKSAAPAALDIAVGKVASPKLKKVLIGGKQLFIKGK